MAVGSTNTRLADPEEDQERDLLRYCRKHVEFHWSTMRVASWAEIGRDQGKQIVVPVAATITTHPKSALPWLRAHRRPNRLHRGQAPIAR